MDAANPKKKDHSDRILLTDDTALPDENQAWKIIIADDDTEMHNVTRIVLNNYQFKGRRLVFMSAFSGEETKELIRKHPDTAIILLDVVMETESAGLDVVRYIREDLNNHLVQILLRTGHPGQAPENKIIIEYGINDYKSKVEITSQKLFTTITSMLRSYHLSYSYNQLNRQLANELIKRREAEESLQKARDNLELRVTERTSELEKANQRLQEEIDRRNWAEIELRKSEEMARALLNATTDFAFLIDPAGMILAINETAAKVLGKADTNYIGKSLYDIFPAKNINSQKQWQKQVLQSGKPIRFEDYAKNEVFNVSIFPVFDITGKIEKLAIYVHDITELKQAEGRIHTLTHDLIKAQENERLRIARDLHDHVAQDLSSSRIACDTLFDDPKNIPQQTRDRAEKLSRMLHKSIQTVRDIAYDLRPPILDQLGLVRAIYQYCEDFSDRTAIPVQFHSAGMDRLSLNFDTEINLYRLIQEALNNIAKHAEATHVAITLVASFPNIILRIKDNGRGFDIGKGKKNKNSHKRMGLQSMEERVKLLHGSIDIQSKLNAGTRIVIEVPCATNDLEPNDNYFENNPRGLKQ